MIIKRWSAPTLQEALALVERECGKDALIVETKKTATCYVVVAAKPPEPKRTPAAAPGLRRRPRRWTRGFAPVAQAATELGLRANILTAVEKTLAGTRVEINQPGDPALPGAAARVLRSLIKVRPLTQPDQLPRCRVTAFVGPTGVGKTTTLAKLAARAIRDDGERVAIVTLDTYRVAAVEQLRAFADMIGAPFEVAFTPDDCKRAVASHASADRILIDTTGRSPFDEDSLIPLRGSLDSVGAASALCVPAGLRYGDAERVFTTFGRVGGAGGRRSLIVTKWDETRMPGEVVSLAIEQKLPLSHITVGQNVPNDILPADAGAIAASLLGLEEHQMQAVLGS